jgi:hypothetical protein
MGASEKIWQLNASVWSELCCLFPMLVLGVCVQPNSFLIKGGKLTLLVPPAKNRFLPDRVVRGSFHVVREEVGVLANAP